MNGRARGLLAVLVAAAVVAIGVVIAQRSGSDRELVRTTDSTGAQLSSVPLSVNGTARLRADGSALVVELPLTAAVDADVTVLKPTTAPQGFRVLTGAVPIPAGRDGALRLAWNGPDCGDDVPDRVLPDLRLRVRVPGGSVVTSVLDTAGADGVLRQSWVAACAIQPTASGTRGSS